MRLNQLVAIITITVTIVVGGWRLWRRTARLLQPSICADVPNLPQRVLLLCRGRDAWDTSTMFLIDGSKWLVLVAVELEHVRQLLVKFGVLLDNLADNVVFIAGAWGFN